MSDIDTATDELTAAYETIERLKERALDLEKRHVDDCEEFDVMRARLEQANKSLHDANFSQAMKINERDSMLERVGRLIESLESERDAARAKAEEMERERDAALVDAAKAIEAKKQLSAYYGNRRDTDIARNKQLKQQLESSQPDGLSAILRELRADSIKAEITLYKGGGITVSVDSECDHTCDSIEDVVARLTNMAISHYPDSSFARRRAEATVEPVDPIAAELKEHPRPWHIVEEINDNLHMVDGSGDRIASFERDDLPHHELVVAAVNAYQPPQAQKAKPCTLPVGLAAADEALAEMEREAASATPAPAAADPVRETPVDCSAFARRRAEVRVEAVECSLREKALELHPLPWRFEPETPTLNPRTVDANGQVVRYIDIDDGDEEIELEMLIVAAVNAYQPPKPAEPTPDTRSTLDLAQSAIDAAMKESGSTLIQRDPPAPAAADPVRELLERSPKHWGDRNVLGCGIPSAAAVATIVNRYRRADDIVMNYLVAGADIYPNALKELCEVICPRSIVREA